MALVSRGLGTCGEKQNWALFSKKGLTSDLVLALV